MSTDFTPIAKGINRCTFEFILAGAAVQSLAKSIWEARLYFFTAQQRVCTIDRFLFQVKLSKASFFTRWYWRRKLYKTTLELRKNNQGIEYIKGIIE